MLRRFGFHKYKDGNEVIDKFPIYALNLRISDLHIIKRLNKEHENPERLVQSINA